MKKNLFLAAAAVVVITVIALVALRGGQGDSESLDVAINLPLSGPIAVFMDPYPKGLRMGLEEGGSGAGLPEGYFSLDVQDNAGKPSQAVTVMQKHKLRGFDVYVSGSTEMTMAIVDEIDKSGKPHFLITFDAFMARGVESRLRILPSYKQQGPLWVEYAKRRGAKRVFALTLNNPPIEEEFTKIVEPRLKELGVEYQRERFEWTGSDYRTLALKAKAFNPDLILVDGYSVHLYPVISSLRSLGLVKDHNTIAALDYVDLLYSNTPKDELLEVAFMCPMFEISGAVPGSADWRKRYESRFGERPSYVAAYAYDTGRLLAAASKKTRSPSTADLLALLPKEGVSGRVALDGDGDLASTVTIARLKHDGTVEELK